MMGSQTASRRSTSLDKCVKSGEEVLYAYDPETENGSPNRVIGGRLALTDPNAHERVLQTALDDLDAKVPPLRRKMTPEEIAEEKAHWLEVGRQLRAKYPYDDDHPPSKVWQE